MYRPIPLKFASSATGAVSLMSPLGINRSTAPQFLDTRFAIDVVNYELEDFGRIIKRK